jgi:xanthine/CO dehydrogenase XdhC/CoxF family maturation factor
MEVIMVTDPREDKSVENFPGAEQLLATAPDVFPTEKIDEYTAVVLMNHSYVKDLHYLLCLQSTTPFYIGLLGPFKRREDLLNAFLEKCPDTEDAFLECLHGPAGLDIGAVTPQEIGIAILAEILMVARNRIPLKLRDKQGSIHSDSK